MRPISTYLLRCARTVSVLLLLAGWGLPARGQSTVVVQIDTNAPQAVVFADSMRLGAASQGPFEVPAATRQIRLTAERADTWTVAPVVATLEATPGDTLSLRLHFPYYYRIESVPYGADVYVERPEGRRRIGRTPLLYQEAAPVEGTFLLEKPGFAVERFTPGREPWNHHALLLSPARQAGDRTAEIEWRPPRERMEWLDYAALGLAVSAGVLSVHYKFKADRLYEEYQQTTDPTLRSRIKAYDVRAGAALGVMQVGIGVFAVRLALR